MKGARLETSTGGDIWAGHEDCMGRERAFQEAEQLMQKVNSEVAECRGTVSSVWHCEWCMGVAVESFQELDHEVLAKGV